MLALLALLLPAPELPQDPAASATTPRIAWQRNLADALAEQKATGLPLLIAVNMDGEVFNERFANETYRDPEFVALTAGYVCVIASPERHSDMDYDAAGNRVECPRFGGCTCSEHIQIEPLLFARWFDGRRNAPRHIGVSPDGKVLFDRYLDGSMQTAIDAIRKHRGQPPPPLSSLEPAELLRRTDIKARHALERLYRDGDAKARRQLLTAAGEAGNPPFDLLRQGLRDADDATFAVAAAALAKVATVDLRIDIEDALARSAASEREPLLARLNALGKSDPAIARLATHLATAPAGLPAALTAPWPTAPFTAADRNTIEAELDRCEAKLKQTPDDDLTRRQLAAAQLALGLWLAANGGKGPELWFEDAARSAAKVKGEAEGAAAAAIVAIAAWFGGDAARAATALAQTLAAPATAKPLDAWLAPTFLEAALPLWAQLAYGRIEGNAECLVTAELSRALAALALLDQRGGSSASDSGPLAGIGLLEHCGLRQAARGHLHQLALRVPTSASAHERWRNRLRIDLGTDAMLAAYGKFLEQCPDRPTAEWFAGLAALVAAEQYERDRRGAQALSAYALAVARFERSGAGNADYADSANHYAVLALAGGAERKHAAGDLDGAVADLLRAHALRPDSLDEVDGLQRKPRAIAERIRRALRQAGKDALAERLQGLLP